MDFLVLSRQQVESIEPSLSHIIISITDPNSNNADIKQNDYCKGILRLSFHDIDAEHIASKYGYELISKKQAREVLDFVEKWVDDIQLIIVQCEAGISRSAGISAALSELYVGHDSGLFKTHIPNMYVYRQILNCNSKYDFNKMFK